MPRGLCASSPGPRVDEGPQAVLFTAASPGSSRSRAQYEWANQQIINNLKKQGDVPFPLLFSQHNPAPTAALLASPALWLLESSVTQSMRLQAHFPL